MSQKRALIYEVAQNQSLSADFITAPTVIKYTDNVAYQINITTTDSVGIFKVQGSLDYAVATTSNPNDVTNPGNWVDLTLGGVGTPNSNGVNDNIMIDMNQVPFNALRIVYTSSVAGTGTCNIYIMTKMLGG